MTRIFNCPCGARPMIKRYEDTDCENEHVVVECEVCGGLHVESAGEESARVKWNKAVKETGV